MQYNFQGCLSNFTLNVLLPIRRQYVKRAIRATLTCLGTYHSTDTLIILILH